MADVKTMELSKEQKLQEDLYEFPYHYIPTYDKGNFSQFRYLYSGYEYLSYIQFILNRLSSLDFNSLLDVGCGDGRFIFEACKIFPQKNLMGIDISKRAIAFAKAINPSGNYLIGDIRDKSCLDNVKFNVITLIETLEHIPPAQINDFLQAIHYYLERDGILIVTVPSVNMKLSSTHYQHFSLRSLNDLLKPFFKILEYNFLNKISMTVKIMEKLISNRIFILNQRRLLNIFYKFYLRHMLIGRESNAKRICVLSSKKSND